MAVGFCLRASNYRGGGFDETKLGGGGLFGLGDSRVFVWAGFSLGVG